MCPLSALKRVLTSVFLKNLWHCSQRRTIQEERALSVVECIAKIPLDSARSLLMPSVDALNNAMSVRALCASTCLCATYHINVENFARPSTSSISLAHRCQAFHSPIDVKHFAAHSPTRLLSHPQTRSHRSLTHTPTHSPTRTPTRPITLSLNLSPAHQCQQRNPLIRALTHTRSHKHSRTLKFTPTLTHMHEQK